MTHQLWISQMSWSCLSVLITFLSILCNHGWCVHISKCRNLLWVNECGHKIARWVNAALLLLCRQALIQAGKGSNHTLQSRGCAYMQNYFCGRDCREFTAEAPGKQRWGVPTVSLMAITGTASNLAAHLSLSFKYLPEELAEISFQS